jgi:hypothetical protein
LLKRLSVRSALMHGIMESDVESCFMLGPHKKLERSIGKMITAQPGSVADIPSSLHVEMLRWVGETVCRST